MRTYDELLAACVRYLGKHGRTQETIDRLESMLPYAWAANLIADAIDLTEGAE
jgi:hypothetical protein